MSKTISSTSGQGVKYSTSLNEDTFFRNYGEYKSSGGENESGYHYDDYEDFSDEE